MELTKAARRRYARGEGGWWVRNRVPQSKEMMKEKQKERNRFLESGMFEACALQDGAALVAQGCKVSPAFMVKQKKKNRLIGDLRRLNAECRRRTMRFEQLQRVEQLAGKGWYFQSRDVQDMYSSFGIHAGDQKCMILDMGVMPPGDMGPRFVRCCGMPFGYVNAPAAVTTWMKEGPLRELRARGIRVLVYIDDFLVCAQTKAECDRAAAVLDEVLAKYGLRTHPTKGQHVSLQTVDHLGLRLDSVRGLYLVPPEKRDALRKMARQILGSASQRKRRVNARWLAQFAGTCISVHLAVPMARFHCRAFFDALAAAGVYGLTTRALQACSVWDRDAVLSKQCFRELRWWSGLGTGSSVGRAIWRPVVNSTMATDASKTRWGAVLDRAHFSVGELKNDAFWQGREETVPAWGIWSDWEKKQHITFLELRAFRRGLEAFGAKLAGRVCLLWEDNMGVVGILNGYSSRSPQMMDELRLVVRLLEDLDLNLRVRWVESALQPADFWTRFSDKADWGLDPGLAHSLMHTWGACTVDQFASVTNALLPRFSAPYPMVGAEAVDAFTISWAGERSWLNPPWNVLGKVLHKLEEEPDAEAVLVAPVWPTAHWWPVLQSLQCDSRPLPLHSGVVRPGVHCRSGLPEPLRNPYWDVRVWFVPARTC